MWKVREIQALHEEYVAAVEAGVLPSSSSDGEDAQLSKSPEAASTKEPSSKDPRVSDMLRAVASRRSLAAKRKDRSDEECL